MEKYIKCDKRLIIVFIDFEAAFGSVHRSALWKALIAEGVPINIVHILQQTYKVSSSSIRVKGEFRDFFPVYTGVRQGCVIASIV